MLEKFRTNGPRGHGIMLYLLDHSPKIFSMFIQFYILLYTYVPIYLPIHLSIYIFICLYIPIYFYTFMYLLIDLATYIFTCLCIFIHLCIYLFSYILCVYIFLHIMYSFIYWLSHTHTSTLCDCKLRGHGLNMRMLQACRAHSVGVSVMSEAVSIKLR